MSTKVLPEKVNMFNGYIDKKPLGFVDCEMPAINFLSDTVSGGGIAGEFDGILIGHTEAMETTLNFRLPTKEVIELLKPTGNLLTLRAAMQTVVSSTGETLASGLRVVMRIKPKGLELGSLTVGESTDTSLTFGVTAVSVYVDKKSILEIDQLSQIFKVNGVDYLEPYRNLS